MDRDNRLSASDETLMGELAAATSSLESSDNRRLLEDAKACFTWRTVDDELELLDLSYDSSMADAALRGGSPETPRMLVFENEAYTVELEVDTELLLGQVVPACAEPIVLETTRSGTTVTHADDEGVFLFLRPESGPIRLKVRTSPGLVTQWLPI